MRNQPSRKASRVACGLRGCAGRWRTCPLLAWPDGRIRLAADVSNWLRPEAAASPERLFCHCYARGKGNAQMIPGNTVDAIRYLVREGIRWRAMPADFPPWRTVYEVLEGWENPARPGQCTVRCAAHAASPQAARPSPQRRSSTPSRSRPPRPSWRQPRV